MFLHLSVCQRGVGWGGVGVCCLDPGPRGRLWGLAGRGVQAHTRGPGRSRPILGVCPGPHRVVSTSMRGEGEGVQAQAWGGGVQAQARRGVFQHALRQTPPQQTATAAGGTHPTGMYSCIFPRSLYSLITSRI